MRDSSIFGASGARAAREAGKAAPSKRERLLLSFRRGGEAEGWGRGRAAVGRRGTVSREERRVGRGQRPGRLMRGQGRVDEQEDGVDDGQRLG